ncbi:transposable element Tcb1 transposase [Trichonephila clavipes]|nr:transposable element Tcb1 transposase [Trichonephila clavipes]
MKLQKRRSGDQYSEHKKSPGRLHTWKNDRKAGGGAYRHQCSCRVRNQQKCRFARLKSVPNHRRKEADGSQQASLLSNSLQQRDDKCHGLLSPDAFTKGAYSTAVLNAASL